MAIGTNIWKQVNLSHAIPKVPDCSFTIQDVIENKKIKFPNDYAKYFLGGYKAGIIGIPT